jgi:hypothetical protein
MKKGLPTPVYFLMSDYGIPTPFVEVHWTQRMQTTDSPSNLQQNQVIDALQKRSVLFKERTQRGKNGIMKVMGTCTGSSPIAMSIRKSSKNLRVSILF